MLDNADEVASDDPLAPVNDCNNDSDDIFPVGETLGVASLGVVFFTLDLLGEDCPVTCGGGADFFSLS